MEIEYKDIKQKKTVLFSAVMIKFSSNVYFLLLLVQHGQNNYFFGRTKLEKIR